MDKSDKQLTSALNDIRHSLNSEENENSKNWDNISNNITNQLAKIYLESKPSKSLYAALTP